MDFVTLIFGYIGEFFQKIADFFINFDFATLWSVTLTLFGGFKTTFNIFIITLVFSLPLGLLITFGSMSKIKPIKWFFKTFVWIIRGTPLKIGRAHV